MARCKLYPLSEQVKRNFSFFIFRKNSRWQPKIVKILPCGSKIRSKSLYLLRFSRYLRFFIFRKNSRWPPKIVKFENFDISAEDSCSTLRVENLLEIALLRFSRYLQFFIFRKSSRWPAKIVKFENFDISPEDSCSTLRVENLLEIARSLTVLEIFAIFHFPQKWRKETSMAAILYFVRHSESFPRKLSP